MGDAPGGIDGVESRIRELDAALDAIEVHGHRGQVEFDGTTMREWNR